MGVMKYNGDMAWSTLCPQRPLYTQPYKHWSQLHHNTKGHFPSVQHQCCSAPIGDGFGVEDGTLESSLGHCHYWWAAAALGTAVFCMLEQLQWWDTHSLSPMRACRQGAGSCWGLRGCDQLTGWGQSLRWGGRQQKVGTSSIQSLRPMRTGTYKLCSASVSPSVL